MQNRRGWADRHLSIVGGGEGAFPPPLENKKRKGEYRPISAVGDKCAMRGQNEYPADYDI